MPELRYDPIKRHWVIIADRRAKRPSEFSLTVHTRPSSECPFCPGNESLTPEAILEDRQDGRWDLRLIPNKFPAVTESPEPLGVIPDLHRALEGRGRHEVLVETELHGARQATYSSSRVTRLLEVFHSRIRVFKQYPNCRYVTLFTNVGYRGGATLAHPHSQILGLPLIPPVIERELDSAVKHLEKEHSCLFCDTIQAELTAGSRVVLETSQFVAICPYASRFAWEFSIYPKAHNSCLSEASETEIHELGDFLLKVLGFMDKVLTQPDYNLIFHIAPNASNNDENKVLRSAFHWHIEVIPRVSTQAGMEWGSGAHVNSTPPERAAALYRESLE